MEKNFYDICYKKFKNNNIDYLLLTYKYNSNITSLESTQL